jgi:hypothetical protein
MKQKKATFAANGVGSMAANGVEPQDAGTDVIPDGTAQRNMASLRPGGATSTGMAPMKKKSGTSMYPEQEEEKEDDMESEDESTNESFEMDISDFANALFEGEELSESFKQKCITIFEAAVNEKVAILEQAMLDASRKIIEEQVSSSVETITEGVDKYLTYVCEEWMTENRLVAEQGMKTEIVENFIHGLKELFENSFVDVPDEKYNVVDELFEANSELESKLNAQINENIELKNTLIAHQCAEAFVEESNGLADTEIEKLASLAEGLEFSSVDQYREKVKLLRESYFNDSDVPTIQSTSQRIDEGVSSSKQPISSNNDMDSIVRTISEQIKLSNNRKS